MNTLTADVATYEVYKSSPEDEIKAMTDVNNALKKLDSASCERVLNWAANQYMPNLKFKSDTPTQSDNDNTENKSTPSYKDLHDFLDNVERSLKLDDALTVAYWYQVFQKQEDFTSQQINDQLKDIGNPIKNITDAFDSLVNQNLVRQTEKSGSSKQARKKFRLTRIGIQKVESMIRR